MRCRLGLTAAMFAVALVGAQCSASTEVVAPTGENDDRISRPIDGDEPTPGTEAPAATSQPTAIQVAPPRQETVGESADLEPMTIELWYVQGPFESGVEPPLVAVERTIEVPANTGPADRLRRVVAAWLQGPTPAEVDGGLIDPFRYRLIDGCEDPSTVEVIERAALVTLCIEYFDGAADADRLLPAFREIIEAAGVVDEAALLFADGARCIGFEDEADPLACLPEVFRRSPTDGLRCPIGRAEATAVVTGVEEWVNARSGPATSQPVVAEIPVDTQTIVYPSTLVQDDDGEWWVVVRLDGRTRCAYTAARFLQGTFATFAEVTPGIEYTFPSTGTWVLTDHASPIGGAQWYLDEAFSTTVSIQVYEGRRIDAMLARQLEVFEEFDYDYPDNWHVEVDVVGADRAVRPVVILSGSGDVAWDTVMIEVGNLTVVAESGVYIEDGGVAPFEELAAFVDSIRIDPSRLLEVYDRAGDARVDLFGSEYLIVEEITSAMYSEAAACGPAYLYFMVDDNGRRTYAGRVFAESVSEVGDHHLVWEISCEGGEPVSFGVATVGEYGRITNLGGATGASVGVRADHGDHHVAADGDIVFEGQKFGSDATVVDRFTLAVLLEALDRN